MNGTHITVKNEDIGYTRKEGDVDFIFPILDIYLFFKNF